MVYFLRLVDRWSGDLIRLADEYNYSRIADRAFYTKQPPISVDPPTPRLGNDYSDETGWDPSGRSGAQHPAEELVFTRPVFYFYWLVVELYLDAAFLRCLLDHYWPAAWPGDVPPGASHDHLAQVLKFPLELPEYAKPNPCS